MSPLTESGADLGLAAAVAWGIWALFVRLAEQTVSPELVVIISYSTGALIALGYFLLFSAQVSVTTVGVGFAVAAGVASGIGSLLYYIALKVGDVGVVSTLTGLYFVVATVLGIVILNEGVTARKVGGIVMAMVAVVLLMQ
ncbi:MAG: EamA family transporter [Halobacteriaceae archaeon]